MERSWKTTSQQNILWKTLRIKRKVARHDFDVKLIISTMTQKFRPGVKLAAIFEPQALQTKVAMAKLAMEIKRTQIMYIL